MAAVLASMPDLCNRTLAEHVPDSHGRCIACRDELGAQAQWPCLTYTVAKQAQDMHEEAPRRGDSGRHGSAGQHGHGAVSQSSHLVPVPAQKSGRHAR